MLLVHVVPAMPLLQQSATTSHCLGLLSGMHAWQVVSLQIAPVAPLQQSATDVQGP